MTALSAASPSSRSFSGRASRGGRSCTRGRDDLRRAVSATLLDAVLTPLLFRRFGRPALERLLAERDRLPAGRPAEIF
jgi:hypothetical protein